MNPRLKEILILIAKRILPSVILSVTGIWLVRAFPGSGWASAPVMVLGMVLNLLALIFMAPTIARRIAEPFTELFFPNEHFEHPLPMYGIPQTKRKRRLYEEAIADLEQIAREYPEEVRPYQEMIDIVWTDLGDAQRAMQIYEQGLATLQGEKERETLSRWYQGRTGRG